MSSIYEDIQALRERFKKELGLNVDVQISAHSVNNTGAEYPEIQSAELTRVGCFPQELTPRQGGKSKWLKASIPEDSIEVTLFY